jgi:hypothetical protein
MELAGLAQLLFGQKIVGDSRIAQRALPDVA